MNIFYLDHNIEKCAQYHNDQHVRKQLIEYTQMLCTAMIMSGMPAPYRKTHYNHRCNVWVRENILHWRYLKLLVGELHKEYQYRFGKLHKSGIIAESLQEPNLPNRDWRNPPKAMPDYCKMPGTVESYRLYYNKEKVVFFVKEKEKPFTWTNRQKPDWWVN